MQVTNSAAAREELLEADRAFEAVAHDRERFLAWFAADASVLAAHEPLASGSAEIAALFGQLMSAPGFQVQWRARKADVSAAGDFGYTLGEYRLTLDGETTKGKYVTVWKREAGAGWKVVADSFNPDA